jgi:hypothetical protein
MWTSDSNQTYGYDPLNPGMPGGSGLLTILPNNANSACGYNNSGLQGLTHSLFGVFPDSTEYKQTASELRQYIINLEATRKMNDLADINFQRSPEPGDLLAYDYTTGLWELLDFVSGGEF